MFSVDKEKCIGCGQCVKDCPVRTISLVDNKAEINNDRCIKCGHCIAICPVNAVSTDTYDMTEVKPYEKEKFTVKSENLLNFIKFRRSVRRFKKEEVSKEDILKIIEAGRYTQTGSNSQDVSYIVLTEKVEEFKNLAYESLKNRGEYILANLTPETEYLKRYAEFWIRMYNEHQQNPAVNDELFFNAPCAIFVVANSPLNGGLASANMANMIEALGLGTFFSGFSAVAIQNDAKLAEFLGLEDSKNLISCIVLGHPDVKYKRTTPRKKADINWI